MILYSFKNDYSEGAHPNILQALITTNAFQEEGYGDDRYTKEAVSILRNKLQNQEADIHLVAGGTQANIIVLSSVLKPYESVIAANTGHINVHEAGAIEATGHRINAVDCKNGKLTPEDIQPVLDFHTDEHMVKPKLVYISNTTEIGSVYNKKELEELHFFCKTRELFLYLDGARLGSALCSSENDLSLGEMSSLLDAFYIGGTKNGALFGEAIVINNRSIQENFRYSIKQKGGLLAKGRLLGLQFVELFKEDLYFQLAKHANNMAKKLSEAFERLGYDFLSKSASNQVFPIIPYEIIYKLMPKYDFYIWSKIDNERASIRLVTSWATKEEAVDCFINDLNAFS